MGDFIRILIDVIQYLWPFRIVWQWEQGCLYVFGRFRRSLGPGIYPVIPFFMEVKSAGVVLDVKPTPLQTVTTQDGGTLTFSASFRFVVSDLGQAYNNVQSFEDNIVDDVSGVLAERLADMDTGRLEPEQRRSMIRDCTKAINRVTREYGCECTQLRFTDFVRNMRNYRLMHN